MASERKDDYVLGNGYSASSRLNLQHCLFKYLTGGWLLHPSIPIPTTSPSSNLKIADVATGTGLWPIELSQSLPVTTQIDGFDISDSEFPPKDFWPENVTLSTFDALGTLPERLRGKYDIVHVRLVALVVRGGDPGVLVENLVGMLKPGGYIQWDEGNPTTLKWGTLNPSTPTPAFTLLTTEMRTFSDHFGLIFTWIPELPNSLKKAGIKDAKMKSLPIPKTLLKPWTDQMLMALEELSYSAVDRAGINGVPGYGSGDEMRTLLKRCYAESKAIGAFMNNDHMVVWGQKDGSD